MYTNRPAPVVMEVAADVAAEDMAEAVVEEDMEVEAMVVAVAVVDMEVTFSSIKSTHLLCTHLWELAMSKISWDRSCIFFKLSKTKT